MLEPSDVVSAALRLRLLSVVLLCVCGRSAHLHVCGLGVCRKLLVSQVQTSPDMKVGLSEKPSGKETKLARVYPGTTCVFRCSKKV